MTIKFTLQGDKAGAKFQVGMKRQALLAQRAAGAAAVRAANEIQTRGRADIAAGGNFGSARWQSGFRAVTRARGRDFTIEVTSQVPYFMVFELGATIRGKPMLWIPLSFAKDAQGVMARDFPGGLFRVDRKSGGAPLLLSIVTGEPKYFGKESVRIPRKFHIRTIISDVSHQLADFYKRARATVSGS